MAAAVLGPAQDSPNAAAAAGAAGRAGRWLASQQLESGAFFSEGARADTVAEALAAVLAAGVDAPRARALAFIARRGPEDMDRGGHFGRLVMGLTTAGSDPGGFGGTDYVRELEAYYNPATGAYDSNSYGHALALLGLRAAGRTVPSHAINHLRVTECPGGGFSAFPGCTGAADVDTTSIVTNALVEAGVARDDPLVQRARSYLRDRQAADGGFGVSARYPAANANSTGLAISAIAALQEDPHEWRRGGRDPITALLSWQHESGAFPNAAGPDEYATIQAIPGVLAMPYPLRAPPKAGPPRAPVHPGDLVRARVRETSGGHVRSAAPKPDAPGRTHTSSVPPAAALLVEGPEIQRRFCVPVKPGMSGLALLRNSGVGIAVRSFGGGLGAAVCRIGGFGNNVSDCPGGTGHWHYWQSFHGRWHESATGPSRARTRAGDAQAWVWTAGPRNSSPSAEPGEVVCRPGEIVLASRGRGSHDTGAGAPVAGWTAAAAAGAVLAGLGFLARRRPRA